MFGTHIFECSPSLDNVHRRIRVVLVKVSYELQTNSSIKSKTLAPTLCARIYAIIYFKNSYWKCPINYMISGNHLYEYVYTLVLTSNVPDNIHEKFFLGIISNSYRYVLSSCCIYYSVPYSYIC